VLVRPVQHFFDEFCRDAVQALEVQLLASPFSPRGAACIVCFSGGFSVAAKYIFHSSGLVVCDRSWGPVAEPVKPTQRSPQGLGLWRSSVLQLRGNLLEAMALEVILFMPCGGASRRNTLSAGSSPSLNEIGLRPPGSAKNETECPRFLWD
jgi:hypothetical protein